MIIKHILAHSHISKVKEGDLYRAYKLFFNTFASEQRLKILNLLRKREMNVSEIQKATGFEQSVVSHNLKRLKSCGFITQEPKGKYRYYTLNENTIKPMLTLIDGHMKEHCLLIVRGFKGGKNAGKT